MSFQQDQTTPFSTAGPLLSIDCISASGEVEVCGHSQQSEELPSSPLPCDPILGGHETASAASDDLVNNALSSGEVPPNDNGIVSDGSLTKGWRAVFPCWGALCDLEFLDELVKNYFTYLYPYHLFPHEPTFLKMWSERKHASVTTEHFCGLLLSMIAALCASGLSPNGAVTEGTYLRSLTNSCTMLATTILSDANRSPHVDDGCAYHLLGLAAGYSFAPGASYYNFQRSLIVLRHSLAAPATSDSIRVEVTKRLFWANFVQIRRLQQAGAITTATSMLEPYLPLPVEVDDEYIHPGEIYEQPTHTWPLASAFVAHCRLYLSLEKKIMVDCLETYRMVQCHFDGIQCYLEGQAWNLEDGRRLRHVAQRNMINQSCENLSEHITNQIGLYTMRSIWVNRFRVKCK